MADNEEIIRDLYAAAEADKMNADKFASLFQEDGYFLDEASGMRWCGDQVREPVTALAAAFPDLHRELLHFYATGDVVIVELKLQGTHHGDFHSSAGTLPPTGRTFDVPCCDVFHLKDGKVASFHCYNQSLAWLQQLGALGNLETTVKD